MRRRFVLVFVVLALASSVLIGGCLGGAYVGSQATLTFHERDCIWAEEMNPENRVRFGTVEEAEDAGYSPCARCAPAE